MGNLAFSSFKAPGTRIVETTSGYKPLTLASFQNNYMIGSGATGTNLVPTQVTSLTDFTNVYGASPSSDSVKLFFRNDPNGILYFVKTPIAARQRVTVTTATASTAYTLTINTVAVTVTSAASPTTATIATQLIAAINVSTVASQVTAIAGSTAAEVIIYSDLPTAALTVAVTAGGMTAVSATPTSPTAIDYVYAISNSFDAQDDWPQGFLLAPEAFQTLTVQNDRLAVGNAMEALCSNKDFDWCALIDAGTGLSLAQAQAEGILYTSAQGHSSFYYPYLIDLESATVPPSAAVASVASRRYRTEGFQQPPAGAKYPILGVLNVVTKVTSAQQETVNPLGINIIRNLRNKGICVWGMRTRSSSVFYQFIHTRVIMDVLNGTVRRGYDDLLFSTIDGQGAFLNTLSQTATSVLTRLWRGKALFGATEGQAFQVVCDFTNNSTDDFENGAVLLEIYAATAPAMERLLINSIRVAIGTLPIVK
ncbi:phage tail sheath family protein [Nostoc sp. FACHB-973]|nr:phage tail sheath family protein [Nostoc sp. FACHB-973]